ncbi:endonuclease/exonuclease/phosphatase family protein [Prevotella sp. KH2C16]|uniref:endonuclease/exonuclease/phosphatase family protein n=1 Tax=Prevotella sp. KH2C16 TaxID=1855325 RepID=UPI002100E367|nr:endonuclease/exonuclease/phosphatase family protein [Prevotella sp. KH2C16]
MGAEGYNYRAPDSDSLQQKRDQEFTVLQWNIWQEGTLIPGGYDAIVNEIDRLSPDFVTLSEVRNYHGSDFTRRLCQSLKARGKTYYSFRTDDSGLLSRYPLKDSVAVFPLNKDHGSVYKLTAQLGAHEIAVYTAHLDYLDCAYYNVRGYDGFTWKETERPTSVGEVLRLNDLSWRDNAARCFLNEARHDLEAGRMVIFGGDFNEPSHLDWTEATAYLYDHHGMVVPWTVSTLLERNGFTDGYRKVYPDVLSYPGFTYPCHNPAADITKLTWAPKADERERIDFIYYQGDNLFAIDAKLFGTGSSIVRSKAVGDRSADPIILPSGTWPTDHKGVWMKFRIKNK